MATIYEVRAHTTEGVSSFGVRPTVDQAQALRRVVTNLSVAGRDRSQRVGVGTNQGAGFMERRTSRWRPEEKAIVA